MWHQEKRSMALALYPLQYNFFDFCLAVTIFLIAFLAICNSVALYSSLLNVVTVAIV